MKILVTGAAGFIGYHLCGVLQNKYTVIGIDNFNDFLYDSSLKKARSSLLDCKVIFADLKDRENLDTIFANEKPDVVIHLAAHAGVRHSFSMANEYITNNIVGTQNLIDVCEKYNVENVLYASTSCVMAGNPLPWKENEKTDHQLNPYGYTKKTNECQFIVSKIKKTVGLRFFTVYGPWGRPDMGLFKFTEAALTGNPIEVFNYGDMKRDFTYVDDIVAGINVLLEYTLKQKEINEIYNIGYGQQVNLLDFISEIEKNFGRPIIKEFVPKHEADSIETWSDTTKLQALGWKPKVSIKDGVYEFAQWYKTYYGVN